MKKILPLLLIFASALAADKYGVVYYYEYVDRFDDSKSFLRSVRCLRD